jgi:hypothetical protein
VFLPVFLFSLLLPLFWASVSPLASDSLSPYPNPTLTDLDSFIMERLRQRITATQFVFRARIGIVAQLLFSQLLSLVYWYSR